MSGGRWQDHPYACPPSCPRCRDDDARAAQAEQGHTPQPAPTPERGPRTVRVAAGDLRPGDRVTFAWGRPSTIISVGEGEWGKVIIVYEYDGCRYMAPAANHDDTYSVPVADLVECSEQADVLTLERDRALAQVDELVDAVMAARHREEHWRERTEAAEAPRAPSQTRGGVT